MMQISPVSLGSVDRLGPRARRCVYWQTDADPVRLGESIGDPEFEKEAWISRVSLEWGVCGQEATNGESAAAAAFYSPPAMVPRADSFPTSPVGSDAALLAGMIMEDGAPSGLFTSLLDRVVGDLRSRGIKALEAFGMTSRGESGPTGLVGSRDGCGAESCVAPTGFLVEHGFTVVADHEVYPRLRLEIESDHRWKADVERALDQLFAERGIPMQPIGHLSGTSATDHRSVFSRAASVRNRSDR